MSTNTNTYSDVVYVGRALRKTKASEGIATVLSYVLILAVGYYRGKEWFYQAKIPLHFFLTKPVFPQLIWPERLLLTPSIHPSPGRTEVNMTFW